MNKKEQYIQVTTVKKITKKKLVLFKVIGVLTPFFILLIIELFLRLFHYGFNPDLFIAYPSDKNYFILNPDASKRYFINQDIATVGNIELFKKEKDSNTLRIFVLGESTTIGYPYFHNGSFHRWLLYRLMHSIPEKNFEIINLSLTAVNSYTVLGFAKEVVNYQPDAVMIYSGHNEYYGALGVGSTGKMGGSPAMVNLVLSLRQLKLVQLMTNAYEKIASVFRANKGGKTRMGLMVQNQEIAYGSPVFNSGISQFRSNLDASLKLLNNHHIPVFISNLVSNEKDLKPFVDVASDSIKIPAFQNNYKLAVESLNKNDSITLSYFTSADKAYSSHASCNYYLGKMAFKENDYKQAKAFFSKALNLDALRFRAPEQMNEVITQLCAAYPNTHLVNTRAVFESASQGGITGNELILEHVHPNLHGYALLSDAFYQALKKEKLVTVRSDQEIPFEKLFRAMPMTSMDSLTGAYRIDHLKNSWPFSNGPSRLPDSTIAHSEEEKLAFSIAFQQLSWADATESLYHFYITNHDLSHAKTLTETLVLEHPTEEAYYNNAANICGELKDYDNATFYFKKSFEFSPSFDKAKFLFVMYFMLDKPEEAIPYLDYAISSGPASLRSIKIMASDIIRLKHDYLNNDSTNIIVLNQVAEQYLKMGNKEGAEKYWQKVLQVDSKNVSALTQLSQLKNSQGKR